MKKIALLFLSFFSLPAMAGLAEGLGYFEAQQYPQAFSQFKPLADKGDKVAQYYVAHMYLSAYGVSKDEKKGLFYLDKSVDQEYEKALSKKAYFLSEGLYMPVNKEAAFQLYEKAAELGDNDALLNLGVLYYSGDGVPRDVDKALELFKAVNAADQPVVSRYIGDIYQYSKGEEEKPLAKKYYRLAAANGDLPSYHSLAFLDQNSTGKDQNMAEAIEYYKYAASQNYAPSQYALGTIYANGEGVQRSPEQAYAWFSLAAARGFSAAVDAQKKLEDSMTPSKLEEARRQMIEIQRNVIGAVPAPITLTPGSGGSVSSEQTKVTGNGRPRPPRRRRGRGK